MKQIVKVLAVSDVHGDMDKVELGDAEVVIVAGDIGPGKCNNGCDSDRWARGTQIARWFAKHKNVRFYVLPGNHDLFAIGHERREKVKELWPDNVKIIKDSGYVDPSGLTIWGMPWNPIHYKHGTPTKTKGGAFHADPAKILRKCEKVKRHFSSLDILVTHAPPRIKGSPYDLPGQWHMSDELAEMLPILNPRLLVCGHHHELTHKPVRANGGKTIVVNVSMKGGGHPSGFQYEPRRIDITVERDIGISMDETSDMKVRLASGVTTEDAEWLVKKSLEIARIVRGVDKLIDEGRAAQTETRDTGTHFAKLVKEDVERLKALSKVDRTGRVKKLLSVVDDLHASRSAEWKIPVLADKWHPNDPCMQFEPNGRGIRRTGNLDFSEYEYRINV